MDLSAQRELAALLAMLRRDGLLQAAEPTLETWRPPDGKPHFAPKAKSVIWLFMRGGLSHMESFDPKPMLTKYNGQELPGPKLATERKTGAGLPQMGGACGAFEWSSGNGVSQHRTRRKSVRVR